MHPRKKSYFIAYLLIFFVLSNSLVHAQQQVQLPTLASKELHPSLLRVLGTHNNDRVRTIGITISENLAISSCSSEPHAGRFINLSVLVQSTSKQALKHFNVCLYRFETLYAEPVALRHSVLDIGEYLFVAVDAEDNESIRWKPYVYSAKRSLTAAVAMELEAVDKTVADKTSAGSPIVDGSGRLVGVLSGGKVGKNLLGLDLNHVKKLQNSELSSPHANHEGSLRFWNTATLLEKEEDWTEALNFCSTWSQRYQDDYRAYACLGFVNERKNDLTASVAALQTAMQMDPDNPTLHTRVGRVLAAVGDSESAIRQFELATNITPNDPDIWFQLGNLLNALKRHNYAIVSFERAVLHNPRSASGWNNLGAARAAINQNAFAINAFKKALELDPNSSNSLFGLGLMHCRTNNIEGAMETYRSLRTIDETRAKNIYSSCIAP